MRYTFVKQHDSTDCAAACLAMVCLHYKKETTITKLRDIMGTDLAGTNMLGMSKCAKQLGFECQAVRVDMEGFKSKYSLPMIANVITKEGMTHFVVVFKITKKYVIVGDPAKDLIKQPIEEFLHSFTGNMLILVPGNSFDSCQEETKNSVFRRYVNLLMPQKKLFFFIILASILLTALGIASSMFNKILMDEILPYKLKDTLNIIVVVFATVSITQIVIGFIRKWIVMHLSVKIDIPLMLGYFGHIYKLPMKFFATRKTGDITTRFSDAFTIKNIFTSIALTLIMDVIMTVVTGIVLFNINVPMFVVIMVMTVITILLVLIFKQPYKRINEEQMQQSSVLNSQIIEGLRSYETIKSNANEDVELDNIEKEYIKSLRLGLKEGMLSNVQGSISSFISSIGNLVLMYVGVRMVINGEISLGTMLAFNTLSGYFMSPVSRLVSLQLQIQEANISMKRISEILDYEVEQDEAIKDRYIELDEVKGDIEIENITFRYGSRKPAIKNVSLTIPKGKKVALVGGSGSGKSTIAKLLLKYYEPEEGVIKIDGVDIAEYENDSLRRAISYMPQNIEIFSKSIYENIRMSKLDATFEEVKEAAKAADAHDFIQNLPLQYRSYLEEAGNGLSGGEKQRIALARAFLKNSNFYIFDEGTSNLDFVTENAIFDMIYNKLSDKSMLIVAHRLATVKHCDEIIVMDKGEILERGTHEQLLAKRGKYFEMWQLQQGEFIKERRPIPEYLESNANTNYGINYEDDFQVESSETISKYKENDVYGKGIYGYYQPKVIDYESNNNCDFTFE